MRLDELCWSMSGGVWHRAEACCSLILLYQRTDVAPREHADTLTREGNYRIIGVYPDTWHDLEPIAAQAVLYHCLEKYKR
jgi:hypothetical protein